LRKRSLRKEGENVDAILKIIWGKSAKKKILQINRAMMMLSVMEVFWA